MATNNEVSVQNSLNSTAALTLENTGANHAPELATPLVDIAIDEKSWFSFKIPDGTFADIDSGDELTYILPDGFPLPDWLSFDATTGTFSGTPANSDVGSLDIEIGVADKAGDTAWGMFTLEVNNVNDTPVASAILPARAATEDRAFRYVVPATAFADIDAGDVLTYSAKLDDGMPLPSWLKFNVSTCTFSGTPANDDVGKIKIQLVATDKAGASAMQTIDVDVLNVNDKPVANVVIAAQQTDEDAVFRFVVPDNAFKDVDAGEKLTLSATLGNGDPLPSWLAFDAATNTFSGTPTNDDVGQLQLKVTATDQSGASVAQTFGVTVNNVNDAPEAGEFLPSRTLPADRAFRFEVSGNAFLDADVGDVLTYSAKLADGADLPSWLKFDGATRTFSGKPTNVDLVVIDVQVVATDKAGATAVSIFSMTVNSVDAAPVPYEALINIDADEDSEIIYHLPVNAFSDFGADGELSYSIKQADGSALPDWLNYDAATRTFSGTPTNDDVGEVAVVVEVTDQTGITVWDSFTVTVNNVNDAPMLSVPLADLTANEDAPFSFTIPNNAFADVDVSDVLTYSAKLANGAALPSWLKFDAATRTFSGTPINSNVGVIDVKVGVTDQSGAKAWDIFTVTVNNVNDAPAINTVVPSQKVSEDQAFSFAIPANAFKDVDVGDKLTFSAATADGNPLPSWLSFDAATKTFSGTPSNDNVGTLQLRVVATDQSGANVAQTFEVTVNNVNDAPVVDAAIANQQTNENQRFNFVVPANAFKDVDVGDKLSLSAALADGNPLPAWLKFDAATNTFSGTPVNGNAGDLQIKITATDLAGATVAQTFQLGIIAVALGVNITLSSGADSYVGGSGNDTITDSGGSDTINGGAGDDVITDQGTGTNVLRGGDGNDTITFNYYSSNTIEGGAGNDLIKMDINQYSNANYANTFNGGAGNDIIQSGGSADTYQFNRGDGQDTINDYGYSVGGSPVGLDKVVFGSGIAASDLLMSVSGKSLVVKIVDPNNAAASDQITIENWDNGQYRIEQFQFADGTKLTAAELSNLTMGWINAAQPNSLPMGWTDAAETINVWSNATFVDGKGGNDTIVSAVTDTLVYGGAGDDVITDGAGNDTIYGGEGNDKITDSAGNDILDGAEGNDTITDSAGNDTINGGAGDDVITDQGTGTNVLRGGDGNDTITFNYYSSNTIEGGAGNDLIKMDINQYSHANYANTFNGGAGNDSIQSGGSADTYQFNRGDGQDTINDYGYSVGGSPVGLDKVVFGSGIAASDLLMSVSGKSLVVKIVDPNNAAASDQITIENWDNGQYRIEQFQFADGTKLTAAELSNLTMGWINAAQPSSLPMGWTDAAETINVWSNATFVDGKGGNDTIVSAVTDTLVYGGAGDDVITDGAGNDTIYGGEGNDKITDSAGNDILDGAEGNDTITDSGGNDTINGGTGDDVITDQGTGTNVLRGGDGNDTITFNYYSSNTIEGGAGNDLIKMDINQYSNANYANTFNGGAGNDIIQSGGSADTYQFNRGDGQDTINDYGYSVGGSPVGLDKVVFGSDVNIDQLWFSHVGNDLEVNVIGTADKFTVQSWYTGSQYHIEQFKSGDGKVLLDTQVDALVSAMAAFAPPAAGQTTLPQAMQDQLQPVLAANWH